MKKNLKELFNHAIILIIGNLALAFAVSMFLVNYHGVHVYDYNKATSTFNTLEINGVLSGGTAGFSLILVSLFSIKEASAELIITITTWFFFLLGAIFLGKKFAIKTLVSTVLYPAFLFVLKLTIFDGLREQINYFDPLLCGIIGGALMGFGCGIVYKIDGSTGGFDIPGLILNKYTRIKLSIIYMIMDGSLVVLAILAKFSLYEVIIGLFSVAAYSIVVDVIQIQGNHCYICEIISDKWEEINKDILALDRGSTIIDVVGGYTGTNRKMIKTMIGKNQYLLILDIVKKHDPNAFMSMHKSTDIFGEGYRDIKKYSNK